MAGDACDMEKPDSRGGEKGREARDGLPAMQKPEAADYHTRTRLPYIRSQFVSTEHRAFMEERPS